MEQFDDERKARNDAFFCITQAVYGAGPGEIVSYRYNTTDGATRTFRTAKEEFRLMLAYLASMVKENSIMEITPLLTSFNSVIRQTGKSLPLVTLMQDNQLITQLAITGDKDVAPLSMTAHFFTGRSLIQETPDILSHIELVFELAIIPFSQPGDAAIQEALAASMYTMETKELAVFMYQFRRDSDGTLRDAHEREDLYRTGDDAQPLLSAFVAGMHAAHRSDDNATRKLQEIIDRYEARLRAHLPQSQMETMADQYETWKKKEK